MTHKIWIKERFKLFQKIFKDFSTHSYGFEGDVCFEILLSGNSFRLWITKKEYTKNTSEQRDKLWLSRLGDMKRDIEDCIESLNDAIKIIERNQNDRSESN